MRSKSYSIKISPIAWKRAHRNSNRTMDHDDKEKLYFTLHLENQHNEEPVFTKGVSVQAIFYMPIPKSLKDRVPSLHHATSPDLEDLNKFLLEHLRGVVIKEPRLICSLTSKKVYDKDPRTEFVITEVE